MSDRSHWTVVDVTTEKVMWRSAEKPPPPGAYHHDTETDTFTFSAQDKDHQIQFVPPMPVAELLGWNVHPADALADLVPEEWRDEGFDEALAKLRAYCDKRS